MFNPWIGTIPCRRAWQPTPVFLLGESHGQKSLAGYSLQGCKESDTTDMNACTAQLSGNIKITKTKNYYQSITCDTLKYVLSGTLLLGFKAITKIRFSTTITSAITTILTQRKTLCPMSWVVTVRLCFPLLKLLSFWHFSHKLPLATPSIILTVASLEPRIVPGI